MFTRADLDDAVTIVHATMPPTPQYRWPLLCERLGLDAWVKHENMTPTGAFKVRGGLVYVERLKARAPAVRHLVSATRGNHGQSIALAGVRAGLEVTIFVPHGNSPAKNRAMRAWGATLIEAGEDFDEAKLAAEDFATEHGAHLVPSFHADLVCGVATYALELFTAAPPLDAVYVPIGMGSGLSAVTMTRDLLGLATEVVCVTVEGAPAFAQSFASGVACVGPAARTFADGMATRAPVQAVVDLARRGGVRVATVADAQVADAMRVYFEDTRQVIEGAGAAPLAALMQERAAMRGKRAAVIACGGNVDTALFAQVLAGATPQPF
ncbi:threonine dehydratase [Hankyongella ginsenosidimutans]|uniref:Threonine dehydratase n=1 Tax=Hankyongella ginsenosidimutans TaxID=1763828 RepID=A0A4D7C4T2_9SPHN|nr:threonine dehydratase [Hankyongella ginsenosidimutans]QCI80091.1 threonine dehydratase [Hankyongella ginsenosidimutans]TXG84110.1 MAG: threonine dehydratase [Sphingomonadales bacterium]